MKKKAWRDEGEVLSDKRMDKLVRELVDRSKTVGLDDEVLCFIRETVSIGQIGY